VGAVAENSLCGLGKGLSRPGAESFQLTGILDVIYVRRQLALVKRRPFIYVKFESKIKEKVRYY
jgi:hypothetical protein